MPTWIHFNPVDFNNTLFLFLLRKSSLSDKMETHYALFLRRLSNVHVKSV